MSEPLGLGHEHRALAEHYREQAARLRFMAALLPGAELRANLRASGRLHEDLEASLAGFLRDYRGVCPSSGGPPEFGKKAAGYAGGLPKCAACTRIWLEPSQSSPCQR
jgi:hypothetical protein